MNISNSDYYPSLNHGANKVDYELKEKQTLESKLI